MVPPQTAQGARQGLTRLLSVKPGLRQCAESLAQALLQAAQGQGTAQHRLRGQLQHATRWPWVTADWRKGDQHKILQKYSASSGCR